MSHKNLLRKDKTCLNCNSVVDQRFCPNCGQENADTRKTFHHLFVHFFEDITHYENAFWKTIKNLLLKPASLTKEYLSGKRLSYLAPVRLYIFISFVTFFFIAILPDEVGNIVKIKEKEEASKNSYIYPNKKFGDSIKKEVEKEIKKQDSIDSVSTISKEALRIDELKKQGVLNRSEADSLKKFIELGKKKNNTTNSFFKTDFKSLKDLDSVRKVYPDSISDIEYWFTKKTLVLSNKYNSEQIKEKFIETIKRNFSKTLFIYMPLFAFMLWLFHDKKRWYYFDHGIFTLHYFSFLLLVSLIVMIFDYLFVFIGDTIIGGILEFIVNFVGYIWMLYYFFPAHHRFYGETRMVSFIKSVFLFIINSILFAIVLTLFIIYTFANL